MRLVTFLGTGNYSETTYSFEGAECRTRYVAAALAQFLKAESVFVLATKQAFDSHANGITEELNRLGLPRPSIELIPSGGTTEELWDQFEVIGNAVTTGEPKSVSFDITHGFRSQPFFAAAVINYLRATLSNAPDMFAYYGEWEKGREVSPVWDISTFISLLDWSNALHGFMKTGHGAELAQLAKKENAFIQKSATTERPKKLSSLAGSIKAFSDNISTVRVPQIITGGEGDRGSAANVLKMIRDSEAEVKLYFRPLYPLLEGVRDKVEGIPAKSLFSPEGHQGMLALAKLYIDYERYPEAAIVVREGWISLYAQSDLSDEEQLVFENRKQVENAWELAEGSGSSERIADQIRIVRNDIQHGGFKELSARNPANSLIRDLDRLIVKFEGKLSSDQ